MLNTAAALIFAGMSVEALRNVHVMRYVVPLREGGSLPAIAEADDGFLYVIKFRGAGQGAKALVAEIIGAETARALGLKIPEVVVAHLDEAFGRTEPDEEIQDLLKASTGINVGLHYLSGSITFDVAVSEVDGETASKIVWLDAFSFNVDRTARNTNMLMWNKELWLIDHGASLYFHHNWDSMETYIHKPFSQIKDHVLLKFATGLEAADASAKSILTPEKIREIVQKVPDQLFEYYEVNASPQQIREAYIKFFTERIADSQSFLNLAVHEQKLFV